MKFKVIPGVFSIQNSFSSDIGWQGLLACGNNNFVQIIDPKTGQLVQTLEKHNSPVHLVKWASENYYHDLKKPYSLKLASADLSGTIIVWEATYATILSDFSNHGKKVQDFHWLKNQEVTIDFILALHSGNELILWNTDSGNKVWSKVFQDPLLDFCIDCYDSTNLAFRGDGFLLLVSSISLRKAPEGNGRKFFICSQGENSISLKSQSINKTVVAKSTQLIKATTKMIMDLGGSGIESLKGSASTEQNVGNCIQILYHSYCQNHIIIVYPREILIMDLMIFQAVSCISLDKNVPSFVKIYSCWQNDIFYCLHENGVVTVRGRRPIIITDDMEIISSPKLDVMNNEFTTLIESYKNIRLNKMFLHSLTNESGNSNVYGWIEAGYYQLLCQTETPRLNRNVRIQGMSVACCYETLVALLTSDSKVQFWELKASPLVLEVFPANNSFLLSPNNYVRLVEHLDDKLSRYPQMLYNLLEPMVDMKAFLHFEERGAVIGFYRVKFEDTDNTVIPVPEEGRIEKWGKLTMNMVTLYQGLLAEPTVMKGNPVNMNYSIHPLIAVGNSKGVVQLWNVNTSQLENEYQIMHCPIKGIDWLQVASSETAKGQILCYGFNVAGTVSTSVLSKVKNNVSVIRLDTGRIIELRNDTLESSIESVRISTLRQYFTILLKDGSLEVWDSRMLLKLRDIPCGMRQITNLEWSTIRSHGKVVDDDGHLMFFKEKFLTIDSGGFMQHSIIDGNKVIHGRQVPVEMSLARVSAMAYRGNIVVLGDIDGNILFWNLKAAKSISALINQGKVLRILFDNLTGLQNKLIAVLSSDGVSVWHWKEATMVKFIKWPKDSPNKIMSVDWLDDGQTIGLLASNEIRIVRATSLETSCSVVSINDFSEPVICLNMLPPKMSLTVKHFLQHQPWEVDYCLCPQFEDNGFLDQKLDKIFEYLNKYDYLKPFELSSSSTAEDLACRCYHTAVLFGDEFEMKFWILTLKTYFPEVFTTFLPWEAYWPTNIFRIYQKTRLWSLDRKRGTQKQTQKCAEAFIMLGELDRAVRLLLETPPTNPSYVSDLQLACLLSNQSNQQKPLIPNEIDVSDDYGKNAHHSTVKLVATQFISNSCLKEGVQLLCAISKQTDACRYLETYNEWKTALWLGKCTLSDNEVSDIEKRWAYNCLQSQTFSKTNALFQYLILKDSVKVLEILSSSHQNQLAVRFIEFCEFLQIPKTSDFERHSKQMFAEFGAHLSNVSCSSGADHYLKRGCSDSVEQSDATKFD